MSAFGTKKPGADIAQQLTYPHIFSEAVAPGRIGYYPEADPRNEVMYPTADIQGIYHQQKMQDANRRALNAVADTERAKYRYLHSHAGYYGMPKAVLSQRKFANPSNGNQADIYNNRGVSFDMPPSVWSTYRPEGLSGGVLFTAEAQKWGRQKLRERIPQLDAINAEKEAFLSGLPVQGAETETVEGVEGSKVKLEIVATLRAILASVSAGKADAFAWSDTLKFMRLFFRWTPSATIDEMEEVMEYFDEIEEALIGIQEVGADGRDADAEFNERIAPNVDIMLEDFQKLREYLTKMMEIDVKVNEVRYRPDGSQYYVESMGKEKTSAKTLKERKALSASLIKSIGFTTLKKASNVEQVRRMVNDVERGNVARDERRARLQPPAGLQPSLQFADRWVGYPIRPFGDNRAGFDVNPRDELALQNGVFEDEVERRNPFRRGDGEDQAQGLEVQPEEAPSEDEVEAPEDLRERLADRPAQPAVAEPAPIPRPRNVVRPNLSTLTPDRVRQLGRWALPQDSVRLKEICDRWVREGYGTYAPRNTQSDRKSILKRMYSAYGL